MMPTNHERVGSVLELIRAGLGPFVERELKAALREKKSIPALEKLSSDSINRDKPAVEWDAGLLLRIMWESWNEVFRGTLGPAERGLVGEMRGHRNKWAHQSAFSSDDTYRVFDSAERLLAAISAPQSQELGRKKMELLRARYESQARNEKKKSAGASVQSDTARTLSPWREVVNPHHDVASGRYQQAEFAADLWQVYIGEGVDEYRSPEEFFRRTFLTDSLKYLLISAIRRLSALGGDPVIQLQTNFGGGKTHSMLALYHLFSGVSLHELPGIESIGTDVDVSAIPNVKRVVLVGNKISPGNPIKKSDGTIVRTLWGELAWQLGGREAYAYIQEDDERATSPGDTLRKLFNEYGPCLILIDEWVAYARQLHDQGDLPAGNFETHFSFAQALTESAKLAKHCLLVVSLPASDTMGALGTQTNDVEVGGRRGREALDRLRNAIGRVESSWRPASAEEGFEIVRRRLFEPLIEQSQFVARDAVAKAYFDLYRGQHQEFPSECQNSEYEARLKAAYPIHPEVFDRLYTEWSTLVKFQRTRGVLRLMAAVIHSLWEKGDQSPLIQPANFPIDDPRVQFELTRYLSEQWIPIIEKDVDGPHSLPLRIDGEVPNLGKFSACRRIARTVYLGSAPGTAASNRGIEDRRIKLGCVMPGEYTTIFADALRRLSDTATYLYRDGNRYWFSTQPTVTKLAEERAIEQKANPEKMNRELERRLRDDLANHGDFARIHTLPQSGHEILHELSARLVVLGPEYLHSRGVDSAAKQKAKEILDTRGTSPRLDRNTLVFLAADQTRIQELDDSMSWYLAWQSILEEKEVLNLTPYQVRQAETQHTSADIAVNARLPETYQWLLVPHQTTPKTAVEWESFRLSGQERLAVRASQKLKNDELLVTSFAATRLRLELDRIPLWRGDHIEIKQLVEDFSRYPYLPRLRNSAVLIEAIQKGLGLLTWSKDSFAYAESFDEAAARYRGLRYGCSVSLSPDSLVGLLVKPERALRQQDAEMANNWSGDEQRGSGLSESSDGESSNSRHDKSGEGESDKFTANRFHGTVSVDADRVGLDVSRIADEVISHLSSLTDVDVRVTLNIEVDFLRGAPENVIQIVTENCRALRFDTHGFERE